MRKRTVLILGAGASCSYGFPVGLGLRAELLSLGAEAPKAAPLLSRGEQTIKQFVHAFRDAQTYSIDAFLSRRPEFADIGKRAVALRLLQCEDRCDLWNESHSDHWYQYLVNELASAPWDEFDPSWLSIITFNYDRSLEVFLTSALKAIYGKEEAEVVEKLRRMQIVHVYGWLGSPWEADRDFLPLRYPSVDAAVELASTRIKVIPEGRDDEDTLVQARQLLGDAQRICILGFGFDALNVSRLGATDTFLQNGSPKLVAATALRLTAAETRRSAFLLVGRRLDDQYLSRFKPMNCIQLLRETLILQ